ncbi:DNA mismatch repair protein MutS [Longimicrobium terrae]|uniref:DNA mismatch repair protein MutS n=1 Tax=Longimicrobium terrae TaxID=1639882 RepID=A0A841GW33_9BACT|nr:DNA mismatch repair protein MutS [Longimicrobium terrae]MBB4635340.1 DNA mismatch repair protein MutS [Longimicrobium terrae]MBB6069733.1 DNA mismatch repair protein MutS [Longimicrobium terrae]NNC31056.1 DNA mismatch repair protein MutS [Longimicrobium terrae]
MASEDTPLMQQWREVKARHPDALVFFRVGDFYELFNEDAVEGSRLLDLTLTSRNNGGSKAPLAGIPAHALENYLRKLVGFGKRVAICDQVEDPALAKGLVRRAVTEMVTPGAVFSDALLESRRNNYLAAIAGDAAGESEVGLALADLTTGELTVRRVPWEELTDVLGAWQPAEVLLPRTWELFPLPGAGTATLTYRGDWLFDPRGAAEELCRHFRVANLAGYGFETGDQWLAAACGALVGYLAEVQPAGFAGLRPPTVERAGGAMVLDEMTRRNLELVETLRGAGTDGTLLKVLDEACTPMGGRLLRRWLLAPLLKPDHIAARLDAVDEFFQGDGMRRAVRDALGGVRDLERLAIKVGAGRATPREMLALATSLDRLPLLIDALGNAKSSLLSILRDGLEPLDDVREAIERAVDPETPVSIADGGVIRQGHNADLDELRSIRDGAVDWIARLQATEREATGITTLKIGFNRVFGYYFEVTRLQADRVPAHYHRKQTLANAERYYTPELKEWEEKVLGAEERIGSLEQRLFAELREAAAREVPRIQRVADHVAVVDVLAGLAEVACIRDFVRPVVDGGFALEIRGGRHPVVETMMPREEFIPNDVKLDEDARVMILTGPNMAGKSTVLRQVGLIALLAQVGSFVPARAAHVGVVDRIFTRVGASDNLVRGQSTFMVEMNETAAILHGATPRSLVLLDEIGRGTSTWDGLSVATATTEHLHDQVGAKTIFATHYHELTRLSDTLDGVTNFSVAVREVGEDIVFLRRLVPGGADRSYGVEVARLAGMPETVVARARQILQELEEQSAAAAGNAPDPAQQLGLFDGGGLPHPAVDRLRQVNPDALTPIQALVLLADLVKAARN